MPSPLITRQCSSMNTAAHVVINSALLGGNKRPTLVVAILIGSLVPDLPMMAFYAWSKFITKASEQVIWTELYFQQEWQDFFDVFNSIPLIVVGIGLFFLLNRQWLTAFFGGMLFHAFADLPLHQQDAHRHFFPFSDWRFESPVSYWDPAYHGDIVSAIEAFLVLSGVVFLYRKQSHRGLKVSFVLIGVFHISYLIFAFVMWM